MQDKTQTMLTEQDAALLEQGASMLESLENDERNRGNCSTAEGAGCSAHAVRRLAASLLEHERSIVQCLHQISEPAAVAGPIEPTGWREQFAAAVYDDLAAADNQDVPLEEYPARILKVLDVVVGPRHPAIVKWRNDAIQACAAIAYRYCRDPESHQYLKQDLQALITAAPALEAPAAPAGEVVYRWQALDFSGYCYGSNPPEDLPARCNLTPFYRQPDAYRAALHEISATGNLTATDQQFARHLKQIARDALAAAPHAPAQEAPDTPAQHQGMTIAGNGAAELGKLMREQRDSRMGVYPDGNPNSGRP